MIQLVQGMQDIKLNNCERQKRWEWERIQVKLFKIGLKGLRIGQIQQSDSVFFTQTTHILIYYIAAKSVVEGSMTLGMMMSLTYIIGQVSAPIGEFYGILSIFLLEFIIPKSQQKRRYVSSIDHTHHIRQEEYDGKEGQHDNGCAPVKMLIWSKDERQQQGKRTDDFLNEVSVCIVQFLGFCLYPLGGKTFVVNHDFSSIFNPRLFA